MADAPPPASSSDPPPPAGPDEPLSLGYLSLRQAGPASEEEEASPAPAGPPGDRCRAMMEVVRKDSVAGAGAVGEEGKWKVSKLVAEHNHGLDAAPAGEAAAAPALGMEFDSVHDAKGFYYGYGERAGFKARTGSNRRSAGTGAMIMQRFLCCRGNYSYRKGNKARDSDAAKEVAEGAAGEGEGEGEGKAGAHKKRGRKPGKKSTPVIELENSVEKGVARAAAGNGQAVPSTKNLGRGGDKKDVAEKDVESVVELEEEHDEVEDATHDGAHDLGDGDGANSDADEDEMEKEVKVKEKRGRGRPRKAVTEGNALQACASTDLGVTASQCAIDERKKILHKYLSKRQSRPSSGRPAKIVSRQALAERRKRGDGGRFLASDGPLPSERRSKRLEKQNLQNEKKPESKEDEIVEAEQDPETEVVAGPGGEPKVGMVFLNEDKAYEFYVSYAGTAGFNVRKGCSEKTANNVTRSRAYVCSKEGFRHKSVTAETKKQRAETRTGCEAHMTVKITTSGKYVVTEYVADHNHDLEAPVVDIQILRSQKLLAKLQQPLDPPKVVLIPNDYKNYIRTRHTKDMQLGDARAISEYLQRMKGQNPSFFYSIQVDEDDQFRNVFWADVKSMMDFNYFGDVVCVDTRYSTSDYCRPLFLFIGVNHHKQPTIFGTAFIYDESVESFKWLFETFKSAMSGNQPRTVLTDSCTTISDAVDAAWPGTAHRFSLLHLYQNATKVLRDTFQGSETFAHDFSRSLYDYEEEGDFLSSWEILLAKYNLKDNEWLSKLYEERERWALPYGRDIFCADIAATLRNDNVDAILTDVLKTEIDLPYFFNRYDKFLDNFNQTFLNMVSVNVGLVHYVLDHIYGTLLHRTKLGTPFFSKGWGGTKLDLLERMVKQLFPEAPCQSWPPTAVQPKWKTVWETKNSCLREGVFRTTCDERLIDALPPESHNARVAFLTPKDVSPEKMACVVHLAGTGDHSFERRLRLGGPLLKDNIATMVLESPYYGQRRPSMQHGAKLQCVSDLLLLGKATIDEARSLLYWLQAEAGYGKMGICGLSMGGVHAAMVGSLHPTPIATLPFLAPHSAVVPFCEGLYRHATAWEALREDAAALAKDATSLSEDAASGITIEQVKDRLRSVLSLTDVTRFPLPKNPQAVIFVGATDDGYIPRHSVMELQKAWPGSEVRWVMGGHVSSFLLHNDSFRKAIVDALDRL